MQIKSRGNRIKMSVHDSEWPFQGQLQANWKVQGINLYFIICFYGACSSSQRCNIVSYFHHYL